MEYSRKKQQANAKKESKQRGTDGRKRGTSRWERLKQTEMGRGEKKKTGKV